MIDDKLTLHVDNQELVESLGLDQIETDKKEQ